MRKMYILKSMGKFAGMRSSEQVLINPLLVRKGLALLDLMDLKLEMFTAVHAKVIILLNLNCC